MPTISSYYSDLEYPTVNEDASTYGTIINTYLDGLLIKLKTVSDRVTNAQTQLGNINRGVNAVDRINNTLTGSIGSSALLPSTGTTLLPDPYSGTYTKTTTWPAFTSELSSYSPPTTQSEVESFDYQGFSSALTTELNRIDATVTQAESDLLAAQKDTCRAKKYVDVYQAGGTLQTYIAGDTGGYNDSHIFAQFTITAKTSSTVTLSFYADGSTGQISNYSDFKSFCTAAGIPVGSTFTLRNNQSLATAPGYHGDITKVGFTDSTNLTRSVTIGASVVTVNATTTSNVGTTMYFYLKRYYSATRTVYPTPDLTECENPNPPYFI